MNNFVHSLLPIIGRVVAGAVGCVAFYIALFMYKDERERWQNRLEAIWIAIDDRAKKTDSAFTALVNQAASGIVRLFNFVFGQERISWKLIAVSVNLSCGSVLAIGIVQSFTRPVYPPVNLAWFLLLLAAWGCAALAIRFHHKWIHVTCLVPTSLFLVVAIVVTIIQWIHQNADTRLIREAAAVSFVVTLAISVLTDIYAVVLIRQSFDKLAHSLTLGGALHGAVLSILVATISCVLPLYVGHIVPHGHSRVLLYLYSGSRDTGQLNVITCVYVSLPYLVLLCLLVHKALWPTLARFTYPLLEVKVLSERKFLIPVGLTAFGIAFGLTTLMDVLKKHLTQ